MEKWSIKFVNDSKFVLRKVTFWCSPNYTVLGFVFFPLPEKYRSCKLYFQEKRMECSCFCIFSKSDFKMGTSCSSVALSRSASICWLLHNGHFRNNIHEEYDYGFDLNVRFICRVSSPGCSTIFKCFRRYPKDILSDLFAKSPK